MTHFRWTSGEMAFAYFGSESSALSCASENSTISVLSSRHLLIFTSKKSQALFSNAGRLYLSASSFTAKQFDESI